MQAMDTLSQHVRNAVEHGDFTMVSLARRVGCTRQHLHAVISGKTQMSLALAEKIAEAVGCELVFKKQRKKISA